MLKTGKRRRKEGGRKKPGPRGGESGSDVDRLISEDYSAVGAIAA